MIFCLCLFSKSLLQNKVWLCVVFISRQYNTFTCLVEYSICYCCCCCRDGRGKHVFSKYSYIFTLISLWMTIFFFSVLFDSFAYSYAVICNVFLIRMPYLYERLWYIFLFAYEIKFEWTLCVKMSDVQCLLNCKSDLSSTDWLHMTYNNK